MRPHNVPLVMLGAALLWFGWFGFNAGSAGASNGVAAATFITTFTASAAAMLGWLIVERIRDGKPRRWAPRRASSPGWSRSRRRVRRSMFSARIIIGLTGGVICALAVGLKYKLGFDDSLDVVAVHMVGGLVGTLMVGVGSHQRCTRGGCKGLFYGGGVKQLGVQAIGAFSVMAYSFTVAVIVAVIVKRTFGLRSPAEDEELGIDEAEHAETAYDLATVGPGSAFILAQQGGNQ